LRTALTEKDTDKAVKLFGKDSYWRDLVSLTWNIKTVEGRDAIADMLKKTLARPSRATSRSTAKPAKQTALPMPGSPLKRPPVVARDWCA
jgi:putative flavoprotein involved in K+ transport